MTAGAVPETDTDLDDVADCLDGCPEDPTKTEPGLRLRVPEVDTDLDGTQTASTAVPATPRRPTPACGCGVAETDGDLDGTTDCVDLSHWNGACDEDGTLELGPTESIPRSTAAGRRLDPAPRGDLHPADHDQDRRPGDRTARDDRRGRPPSRSSTESGRGDCCW